jgi:hypothetical protein
MLTSQEEQWDKTVSLELDVQKKPQSTVSAKKATPPYGSPLVTEAKTIAQFPFRILSLPLSYRLSNEPTSVQEFLL